MWLCLQTITAVRQERGEGGISDGLADRRKLLQQAVAGAGGGEGWRVVAGWLVGVWREGGVA